MPDRPTGRVTFLFTDIEGSTQLWEHEPAAMKAAWHRQEGLVRAAILAHGGFPYKMIGDAFQAAFHTAPAALAAAVAAQRALAAAPWETTAPIRVRMALHTGTTEEWPDDYVGPLLNRVARLLAAGHGGQILLTATTYELVRDALPPGVTLRDLGERRLKDLIRPEHVWQAVGAGLPAEFPPLKTLDRHPNNLPAQPNAFIGRETELQDLTTRLRQADVRLLTLTGPGGTGKTRLALQVAANLLDGFPNGCWFVDLAPLADPALAVSRIAGVLDVPEQAGQPLLSTLQAVLQPKRLLLVLDNFEHLVAAAADIGALLAAAPGLKMLVTSRVLLQLYGERDYPVPPLALPDPRHPPPLAQLTQYDAVRLFIARAQEARPDFAVSNTTAPAVAAICVRLDGLPLAIELAAARIKLFAPEALLRRLDARLAVLTGGARDRAVRQQTLRGTIEWSYNLLAAGEQRLFARLAVFRGGGSLEAVQAVCSTDGDPAAPAAVANGVQVLVNSSLLAQRAGADGAPRFGMLETIQEYAAEKLAAAEEARLLAGRHLAYFGTLAEQAAPHLRGHAQLIWLARLDADVDNLRVALTRAAAHDRAAGLELAGALGWYWVMRGLWREGRAWLDAFLEPADPCAVPARARGRALLARAEIARRLADLPAVRTAAAAALAAWQQVGDTRGVAASWLLLGVAAGLVDGDRAQWAALAARSLALYRAAGDAAGMAMALYQLGTVAAAQGRTDEARAYLEQALLNARQAGDRRYQALALQSLGLIAAARGDFPGAAHCFRQGLDLWQALQDPWGLMDARSSLGWAATQQGDWATARQLFEQAVVAVHDLADRVGHLDLLVNRAALERATGNHAAAWPLLAEAVRLARAGGYRRSLGDALYHRGHLALAAGDLDQAAADLTTSLPLWLQTEWRAGIAGTLAGLAAVALARGRWTRAGQLAGAVAAAVRSVPLWIADRPVYARLLAAGPVAPDPAAWEAAFAAGQALTLEEAVALALEES